MGLARRLLERHGTGDLEGDLRRVHVVVAAVEQRDFDVDNRIARQGAVFGRFLHSLFDGGNVLAGNGAAPYGVDEFKPRARRLGLELYPHIAILAATTGLADKPTLLLDRFANGFLVGDLRPADVGADVEFAQQTIDDNFQVQLAHPRDDRLTGLLVGANFERRIFGGELLQRQPELFLVGFTFRFDGDGDYRIRKIDGFQ